MSNSRLCLSCLFLLAAALLFGCSTRELMVSPTVVSGDDVAHGEKLVKGLAACGVCHGVEPSPLSPLAGGRETSDRYGAVAAANITPSASGIAGWSVEDVVEAIRTSSVKDRTLSSEVHRGFEWLAEPDMLAIAAYLLVSPPVENSVERRDVSFVSRNTVGFFEQPAVVRGYVPAISKQHTREYGRYLTNNVARCGVCHDSEGSLLTNPVPLAGGRVVRAGDEERVAPNLTGSTVYGIAAWSEEAIVHYLMSGEAPDGRVVDPAFCPTSFYRLADAADLAAIAHYLKTVPAS